MLEPFMNSAISKLFFILLLFFLCACSRKDPANPDPAPGPEFQAAQFTSAQQCATCHPNHYQEWRSSMHAYAFVDPVFFAMHDRGQRETAGRLDQFCTKCHSPIASRSGETPPFFDRNALSPVSREGVTCDVCHSITRINEIANADFAMSPGNVKYGSLDNPAPNGFHGSQFNALFDRSEFCGSCHNVINPENVLVEETHFEWSRISPASMAYQCQDCHMPTYTGEAAVGGPQREVHRHYFAGVDVPLIDFPGADLQRQMAEQLLQSAADLSITHPAAILRGDTLVLAVQVQNTGTGHDLPSGVAAERQMWIAVVARDAGGRVLYQSGQLDANGDLMDHHSALHPHADRELALFRQIMYDGNGKEVLFFWQAKRVQNDMIPFLESREARYRIAVPADFSGKIFLQVILRFRSLPPYFLRELNLADLVAKVPIVDMARAEGVVDVF